MIDPGQKVDQLAHGWPGTFWGTTSDAATVEMIHVPPVRGMSVNLKLKKCFRTDS